MHFLLKTLKNILIDKDWLTLDDIFLVSVMQNIAIIL